MKNEVPIFRLHPETIKESVPTFKDIEREFMEILRNEGHSDEQIYDFLSKCEDIEKFMRLYVKLDKSKEHFCGRNVDSDTEVMIFGMIDELNRAYGDCVVDGAITGAGYHKTYGDYRENIEEHKRVMAETFVWNLWEIKDIYAKVFKKAVPEINGKVTKGQLVTIMNELQERKIIYDYNVTDIIFEEDKNGNKIYNPRKSQYKSFFRPGNTIHGKLGPRYKKVVL